MCNNNVCTDCAPPVVDLLGCLLGDINASQLTGVFLLTGSLGFETVRTYVLRSIYLLLSSVVESTMRKARGCESTNNSYEDRRAACWSAEPNNECTIEIRRHKPGGGDGMNP